MLFAQRGLNLVWIVFMILMMFFSSLNLNWLFDHAGLYRGPSDVTEVVEEGGFSIRLEGVLITGDADIAPKGTSIRARLTEVSLPDSVTDFSETSGDGLDITLGDDMQPATPLTIRYTPGAVTEWFESTEGDADLMPVVFASTEDEPRVEFAITEIAPDGSVIVTTDHLSWVSKALVSVGRFQSHLNHQVSVLFEIRSDAPDCVDQAPEDVGWEFSPISNDVFWPCAIESAGALEVGLTNNSPEVWTVSSTQASPGVSTVMSLEGMVVTGLVQAMGDWSTTAPIWPPDGNVTFTATSPPDQITFDARLHIPLTLLNSVYSVVSIYIPGKALTALGGIACFLDIVDWSITNSGRENEFDRLPGDLVGTIIRCMGEILGALGKNLLSTVAAGPAAIAAITDTIVRSASDNTEFAFTVSRFVPVPVSIATPGAAAWPTDRDDGPGRLFIWLGANGQSYPDWVACDDARDWCLVGNDDDWHLLVRMDGLEIVGEIHDTYENPREGLGILGLPDDVINQILGD